MHSRVLITGATGFVGSHVSWDAMQAGYVVRTVARIPRSSHFLQSLGCEVYSGDLLKSRDVDAAVTGCKVIVHAAAKVGDRGTGVDFLRANLGMLKNVLAAAGRSREVEKIILISTLGVYEPRNHDGTDETSPMAHDPLDGYTLSKIECEKFFSDWLKSHPSVQGIILRPGFVYGPWDRTVIPQLVTSLRQKRFAYFGKGQKKLSATYVKNLSHAVQLALAKKSLAPGVVHTFNIHDGVLPTRKEFVEALAQSIGIAQPRWHLPEGLALFLCRLSQALSGFSSHRRAPLLSMAKFKFLAYDLNFSIEKIRRELGYVPQYTLDVAMAETAAWVLAGTSAEFSPTLQNDAHKVRTPLVSSPVTPSRLAS